MISVCMATYNGEPWVREQLESVLEQLGPGDEVIVVDDASTDATVQVIEGLRDKRIKLWRQETNLGHVKTFEKALSLSSGEYVLLSDQDDVWVPGRVGALVSRLTSHRVVASNYELLYGEKGLPKKRLVANGWLFHARNLLGVLIGDRPYFGCAMGIQGGFVDQILPFPRPMEAHDVWVAIAGNVYGSLCHLEDDTVLRRIHGSNLTPLRRRSLGRVVGARVKFVAQMSAATKRRIVGQ